MIVIHALDEAGTSMTIWSSGDAPENPDFNYRAIVLEAARRMPEMVDFSIQRTCPSCKGTGTYQSSFLYGDRICSRCQGECCVPANDLANGSML